MAVPVGELGHILPIPDPDTPAPGNRRVSRPHARGFADYWCENSSWIAPPILVDTPYSLNQYFEPLAAAGAIVAGKIHLPSPQDSGLQILDGQHRVLGWDMIAMSSGAVAFGQRLQDECVTVEILERVDREEHQQYFFDIASNAKGITKSVTAGFDKRNMLYRAAQSLAVEHPLFAGRVDFQNNRAAARSEHVLPLQNVVDLVTAVAGGIDGGATKKHVRVLDEHAVRDVAESALAVLLESFDVLADVVEEVITPRELRESSLLGSITILRALLGAFHALAVEGNRVSPAGEARARDAFAALAPSMALPVSHIWMATGTFASPASRAPTARRQDLRFLVGFIASLAPESVLTALPERRPSVDEDGAGTHAHDDDDDDDGDVDDDDDDEDDDAPESPDDEDATSDGSGPEALSIYLRQAGRIELLSAAQEVSLAKRIEAGLFAQERLDQRRYATVRERRDLDWLVSDGLRASELFVSSNLRLVLSIARRYVGHGLDIEDLIQEGNLGLIRAVQKFDYKQGFKFSTYATWWVRQAITRAMADQGRVIRLPVHVNEDYLKVRGTVRSLVKRGVDRPQAQQIAGEAELALEDVERLITWSRPVWFLDERLPAVGDERWGAESVDDFLTVSMSDVLVDIEYPESTDPHERVVRQEAVRHTHVLLDTLSEREAGVLAMRFGIVDGIPRTLDEIGKVYGVTRERIRQIEKVTLERLRQDRAAEAFRQAWE